ncbi:hypothetical protein [Methylocystis sp.]|uniref:hypothetical protein n=1 Tax=Methylocystis sp. TaxID=1911079 RepID=UPI002733CAD5|nr:hypothetical protein [Methylocystis sp.]MDP3553513.1 hypothetical protein [Methylocystis sp.]
MNKYALTAAAALFLATTAPSFAFDAGVGLRATNQTTRISCDTHAEDDQAMCASKCEDAYLKDQQSITANMSTVKANRKACDEKCGCPQNSKGL